MSSYHMMENLLTGSIRCMAHTDRYATYRMNRTENVAEHCWFASIFALALLEDMKERHDEWYNEMLSREGIRPYRVLSKILCHDLEERLSGDIVASFKKHGSEVESVITETAMKMSADVFRLERIPDALQDYCETAKDPSTPIETAIINLADFMCVTSTLIEEFEMGNQAAHARLVKKNVPFLKARIKKMNEDEIPKVVIEYYKQMTKIIRKRCGIQIVNEHTYIGESAT